MSGKPEAPQGSARRPAVYRLLTAAAAALAVMLSASPAQADWDSPTVQDVRFAIDFAESEAQELAAQGEINVGKVKLVNYPDVAGGLTTVEIDLMVLLKAQSISNARGFVDTEVSVRDGAVLTQLAQYVTTVAGVVWSAVVGFLLDTSGRLLVFYRR